MIWLIASALWPNYSQIHAYSWQGGEERSLYILETYPHGQVPLKESPCKGYCLECSPTPAGLAAGHNFSLLHSGMVDVHSFPRILFLKPWRGSREVVFGSVDSLGYSSKRFERFKFQKKKSSTLWLHTSWHHHPLLVGYVKDNTASHTWMFKTPSDWRVTIGVQSDIDSNTTTFKAQLSIWRLVAQSNQEK